MNDHRLWDLVVNRHCRLVRRCPDLTGQEATTAARRLVLFQDGDPIRRSSGPGTWTAYMSQMDDHHDVPVRFVRLPLP